ncbi:MAG: hypothetical protein E6Q34_06340 [Burkholderiaceae bacterium]|nr:MAG: hypothetical protein E6Q34_06340 [Burkholderiaceae bacterium]
MTASLLVLPALISAWPMNAYAQSTPQSVEVNHTRHPEERSYRFLHGGRQFFESLRARVPGAVLRFRLIPLKLEVDLKQVRLRLAGETFETPIHITEDFRFELPNNDLAFKEDAVILSNYSETELRFIAEVKSPDLPENRLRLGELRVNCEVFVKTLRFREKTDIVSLSKRALLAVLSNPCLFEKPTIPFLAEQPIFKVSLSHGSRHVQLPLRSLYGQRLHPISIFGPGDLQNGWLQLHPLEELAFIPPLSDTSWPDDTLIEIEFMED